MGGIFRCNESKSRDFQNKKPILGRIIPDALDRHCKFNTPYGDGLYMRLKNKEWFCAFKSLNQLNKWFKKSELSEIAKNNYRILKLKVREYQEGDHQIVFTKESIVKKKDLTHKFLE